MKKLQLAFDEETLDLIGKLAATRGYYRDGFIRLAVLTYCEGHAANEGDAALSDKFRTIRLQTRVNKIPGYIKDSTSVPKLQPDQTAGAAPKPWGPKTSEPMMDYSSMEDPPKQSPWIDRCKKWAGKEDAFRIILEDMQAELTNSSDGALLRMLDERAPDVIERSYKQFWWKENPALAISTVLYEMIKPVMTPEENAQSVSDLEAEYQRRIQAK